MTRPDLPGPSGFGGVSCWRDRIWPHRWSGRGWGTAGV